LKDKQQKEIELQSEKGVLLISNDNITKAMAVK
jgi:hypothetical protein